MKRDKDIRQVQIEQLERDIKYLEDILSGSLENYTNHPLPVLREALESYKVKLSNLLKLPPMNLPKKGVV